MADVTVPTPTTNSGTGYKEILATKGVTLDPALNLTKSFAFDGTSGGTREYFNCGSGFDTAWNGALVGSNKKFTIAIWYKKVANAITAILSNRTDATNNQFFAFINSSNKISIVFYTNLTNFINYISTPAVTDTSSFHLMTITYDGTLSVTARIAVNFDNVSVAGTTSQTGTFTTINNITSPSIEIGGRTNPTTGSLNGNIHCIGLFNDVLTSSELTELYHSGNTYDWRSHSAASKLVSYMVAGNFTAFGGTNWSWRDIIIGSSASATSANMEVGDEVSSAPPS